MLRILFLSANPRNTPNLNLKDEVQQILDRLRSDGHAACVDHYSVTGLTFDDLESQLRNPGGLAPAEALRPNIIHLSVHGDGRSLQIETPSHDRVDLAPEAFQNLLTILNPEVRCVVLNACLSARQAELLNQRVPCVIGMQGRIFNASAERMAVSFYAALAAGATVEQAFALATNAIQALREPGADVPKLYHWPHAEKLRLLRVVKLFAVYAEEDRKAFDELAVSVAQLDRAGVLRLLGMDGTPATGDPTRFVDEELERAKVVVNLVSPKFVESPRCTELTRRTLRRIAAHQTTTVCIVLREVIWEDSLLGNLQRLPRSGTIFGRAQRDTAWMGVTKEMITVVRECEERLLDEDWGKVAPPAGTAGDPAPVAGPAVAKPPLAAAPSPVASAIMPSAAVANPQVALDDTPLQLARHELADQHLHVLEQQQRLLLLSPRDGGARTLVRQMVERSGLAEVAITRLSPAPLAKSAAAYFRALTGDPRVQDAVAYDDWQRRRATGQRRHLIVLLHDGGEPTLLEDLAAALRGFEADERFRILIAGEARAAALRFSVADNSYFSGIPFAEVPELTASELAALLGCDERQAQVVLHATSGHPAFLRAAGREVLRGDAAGITAYLAESAAVRGILDGRLADDDRHRREHMHAARVLAALLEEKPVHRLSDLGHNLSFPEVRLYYDGMLRRDAQGRTVFRCEAVQRAAAMAWRLWQEVQQ